MEPITPNGLSLWGLDDQRQRLVSPAQWPDDVFLFRVWFESTSTVKLDPQTGFVAHLPVDSMPRGRDLEAKVYNHVDRKGLHSMFSPFISTSLSLPWVLATANNMLKYNSTNGIPIKISVIKAAALDPGALIVALDHLPSDSGLPVLQVAPYPNHAQNWKAADHSQEILVLNRIPASAVLGNLDFSSDLQKACELPWITYDTSSFPGVFEHYSARQYAEVWARTFRRILWSGQLTLNQHALGCLKFALRLLNVHANSVAHEESALDLATYLCLWAFREYPPRKAASLAIVQVPSRADAKRRIREHWEMLSEINGDLAGQSEGSDLQKELDKLHGSLARVTITRNP